MTASSLPPTIDNFKVLRLGALLVALPLVFLSLACAAKRSVSGSYFSSLDYQARQVLDESLFEADTAILSNEAIERILNSKIELPESGRLALLRLGDQSNFNLVAPGKGDSGTSKLLDDLGEHERIDSVALLPSLLVPKDLSIAKLRAAAARFQSDLLFVFRTYCQRFQRGRLLRVDEAKAYCLAEGVLLDVRSGIVPFSAASQAKFATTRNPDDLNSYETARRSESEAIEQALFRLSEELSQFLTDAP